MNTTARSILSSSTFIYSTTFDVTTRRYTSFNPFTVWFLKNCLRFLAAFTLLLTPWANYQLIKFVQYQPFYNKSSSKWFIIFKAIFETIYIIISAPLVFGITYQVDLTHLNVFTCNFLTYFHYLSDDLIPVLLMLLCFDRVLRYSCSLHLRTRVSLIICLVVTGFFVLLEIHHLVRLEYTNGYCHKVAVGIFDSIFDIYYSYIFTLIVWILSFIATIHLCVLLFFDQIMKKFSKENKNQLNSTQNFRPPTEFENDKVGLVLNSDEWEDQTTLTIEKTEDANKLVEEIKKQNQVERKLTIGTIFCFWLFLLNNFANFIIFILHFVHGRDFSLIGHVFIYIALFPMLLFHSLSYFIFNHLTAFISRFDQSLS